MHPETPWGLDEATAAVAQQPTEIDLLPFELKILKADAPTETLALTLRPQTLELEPGQRWLLRSDSSQVHLSRQQGEALLKVGGQEVTASDLRPGERLELLGRTMWLVDTRAPFLGSLEGYSGEYSGRVWNLSYQSYRMGRRGSARQNDIELNHPTVSRTQATLYPGEGGEVFVLCETASSPVLVNSVAVGAQQSVRLQGGDSLQLGELTFRFRQVQGGSKTSYFPTDGTLPPAIGAYTVVGKLGSGGMGVVYEGRDLEGREVAIKVPMPHLLGDSEFVRRFNREMKLGTHLDHPRVTRIVFFEPAGAENYPYMVMEKLNGMNLERQPLPLPLSQALDWTGELLEALAYLHSQGVVHRDLKPANLYRVETGIKIADLGIAHFSGTVGDRATQTGTILGTPVYLDPAMLRGQTADARADLYACGLLLYEWIVGSLPYPSDPLQIFRIKLSEDLPPMTDSNPQLPVPLCQFVDKLIHPFPEGRFASAQDALEALEILRADLKA
ncbi:MAG: protein kinase [Candidatus Eremiobacteraeota bacterium]|nr:protein kinase [Candidatus Eremiobacteraeota bacterium]